MSDLTGASASSFPQTAGSRTLDEMAAELAESTGGENRPKRLQRARNVIRRSIRQHNRIEWKFNRVKENITLSSPESGTTNQYGLTGNFRTPYLAILVDSDGNDRNNVEWIPYRAFNGVFESKTSQVASPSAYTARNIHEEGVVIVGPKLDTSNLTYPTMRLEYFRRIKHPAANKDTINVPEEVEESIFTTALYLYLLKERSPRSILTYKNDADRLFLWVEQEWRDFHDFGPFGGNE